MCKCWKRGHVARFLLGIVSGRRVGEAEDLAANSVDEGSGVALAVSEEGLIVGLDLTRPAFVSEEVFTSGWRLSVATDLSSFPSNHPTTLFRAIHSRQWLLEHSGCFNTHQQPMSAMTSRTKMSQSLNEHALHWRAVLLVFDVC